MSIIFGKYGLNEGYIFSCYSDMYGIWKWNMRYKVK